MDNNQVEVPVSKLARWAYRFAWIPGVGLVLYPMFAALAMLRISLKGLQGLYLLGKGLKTLLILNILLYISIYFTAMFPQYYPFLPYHGKYTGLGQTMEAEYRFGQIEAIELNILYGKIKWKIIDEKQSELVIFTINFKTIELDIKHNKNIYKDVKPIGVKILSMDNKDAYIMETYGNKIFAEAESIYGKMFYESGIVKEEGYFAKLSWDVGEVKKGTWKYYDENGKLIKEEFYDDKGEQIKVIKYENEEVVKVLPGRPNRSIITYQEIIEFSTEH